MKDIVRAVADDEGILLDFLSKDRQRNTFLIANIENYGLKHEALKVFCTYEDDSLVFVYLIFFSNILFSGDEKYFDPSFVHQLKKEYNVQLALGFSNLIGQLSETALVDNLFLSYDGPYHEEIQSDVEIIKAKASDVDDIYEFLLKIEETKDLYKDKNILNERIHKGDGDHFFIKSNNEIVAHVNTSANSEYSVMLGGLGIDPSFRDLGYAKALITYIIKHYASDKKSVCTITQEELFEKIFKGLGFKVLGNWNFYNLGGF